MKTCITILALACAAIAGPASALTFNGAQTQGASAINFSETGLLAFNVDFKSQGTATLNYTVTADDLSTPLQMNAVLNNIAGTGFAGYDMVLSLGSFASAGSAIHLFNGAAAQVTNNGGSASLRFAAPDIYGVEIGDAFGSTPGANNWVLSGLQAGDQFSISVSAVPEPGSYALMLAGMLGLGLAAQKQRRR